MPASQPAYRGDLPYVFVCYAHADAARVFPEIAFLSEGGFPVWYDEGIHAGVSWRDEVADRILHCSWFVYFVSPASVRSSHCHKEVNFAIDAGRATIVIHLQETQLPPGLHLAIGDIQAIIKPRLSPSSYERKLMSAFQTASATPPDRFEPKSGFSDETLSIAVLPFVNISNDPAQEHFCDGITEEVINGLAGISELKVIARTSSFEYKNRHVNIRTIGDNLNVNHVIEGSVRTAGTRVRISAQLVTVLDGTQVWSRKYDRHLTDVFEVQDDITSEILEALQIELRRMLPAKQRVAANAVNAFLLGRFHTYRMEYGPALAAYTEALEIEPDYADVHAGLAQIYDVQDNISSDPGTRARADYHVECALALNPQQSMALCIQLQRRYLAGDLQSALDRFAVLLRNRPNEYVVILFYESYLRCIRRETESLRLLDRLAELDPLNSLTYFQKGEAYRYYGKFDLARRAYEQAGELGMPTAGALATLANDMGDKRLLEEQLAKPRAQWGVLRHYYDVLSRNPSDGRSEEDAQDAGTARSAYDRFVRSLKRRDLGASIGHLREGIVNSEWLSFSYALGTAGTRRVWPALYASGEYQALLRETGLDAQSLDSLRFSPLPF